MIGFFPVSSVQAGFDWVSPPSSASLVSKTAPVQGVEAAVLPPQAGVAMREQGTAVVPQVMVPSTPVVSVPGGSSGARTSSAPVLSYPDEESVPVMAAPTQILDEPVVSVPAVSTATQPSSSLMVMEQHPRSVYPPRGNIPSRPLGAAGDDTSHVVIPEVSVRARQTMVPIGSSPILDSGSASGVTASVPVSTVRVVTTAPAASSSPRGVVEGFGTNVPLSLAFEQIVPAGWTIEDQAHLDRSMMVSWAGGRPWDKVLEDMLYAHGVRVSVTGSSIVLFNVSGVPLIPVSGAGKAVAVPSVSAPVLPARVVETLPPVVPPISNALPEQIVDREVAASVPSVILGNRTEDSERVLNGSSSIGSEKFDAAQIDLFSGRTGEKVQDVLIRWGRMAHVQVMWNVGVDLTLPQSFAVNASFPRAVERLLNIYHEDPVRPVADLETNPASGSAAILRVVRAP